MLNRFVTSGLVPVILAACLSILVSRPATAADGERSYTVIRSVLVASNNGPAVESQSLEPAPFVVNTNLWSTASLPLQVSVASTNEISGVEDVPGMLGEAIAIWNDVTPESFTFSVSETAAGGAGACDSVIHLDGLNSVTFAPLEGILGLTCTVYLGSGATNELVEFDMVLSSDALLWSLDAVTPAGKFDLATTLLHELGHAAGLGHGAPGTVMDGVLAPGTQRRQLTEADAAGLRAAYPRPSSADPASSQMLAAARPFRLRAAIIAHD